MNHFETASPVSSSHRTLVPRLILELLEGDAALSALVEFAEQRFRLAEANEEAARFKHPLHFGSCDRATVVEVETVKRLVGVEGRVGIQALPQRLRAVFDADVGAPHGLELGGCVRDEHIESIDHARDVVGASSAEHLSVVGVERQECFLELDVGQLAVLRLVIPSHEELALVEGRVHADGIEANLQLGDRDDASPVDVENVECVENIEVLFLREQDLVVFQFLFEHALLA